MALIKTWRDDKTGLVVTDAYHKVGAVVLDPENRTAQFTVVVFRDALARAEGKQPLEFATRYFEVRNIPASQSLDQLAHPEFDEYFSIAVLDAGTNPVQQAYLWMKTQPFYKDALDA